jgi:hypothetical protein
MNPQLLIIILFLFTSIALLAIFILGKTKSNRTVAIAAIVRLVYLLIVATIVIGMNPDISVEALENMGRLFSRLI